jgi:hypothetical protein
MAKKFLLLFPMFLLFLFCNCNSSKKIKLAKELYEKGQKSCVILGALNNVPQNEFPVANCFTFKNEKRDVAEFVINNGKTEALIIEPGEYKLTNYSLYGSKEYGTWRKFVSIDFSNEIESSFSIRPGETTYLGSINTKILKVHKDKNFIKAFFNMGTRINKIEFETFVEDKLIKSDREKYENSGIKEIKTNFLKWQNISILGAQDKENIENRDKQDIAIGEIQISKTEIPYLYKIFQDSFCRYFGRYFPQTNELDKKTFIARAKYRGITVYTLIKISDTKCEILVCSESRKKNPAWLAHITKDLQNNLANLPNNNAK